ncbi:MAG: hypothetical protein JW771_04425 [Candidatus Thermoplasmatota archaeon]|nr:hypothetical protein [Candidatus Thermoplasmatota archaeon]
MVLADDVKTVVKDTGSTFIFLLKIMIPVSIVVKILSEYGLIDVLGTHLTPAMGLVGLPGEFGLVLATAMLVNIYGALIVFFQLSLTYTYSVAQVTILACMILIAHTLPIESRITQKAGVRLWYTLTLRIGGAFVFGAILHLLFSSFHLLQQENVLLWKPETVDPSLTQWVLSQVQYYLIIFLVILALMALMHFLKRTGILEKINTALKPGLELLGMSKHAALLPLIGMTLGLSYGGGVIVNEAKAQHITKKDVFFSLSFMNLSHSLIEDTLLMLLIGASLMSVFVGRILFTVSMMLIIVTIVSRLPKGTFTKYFMNKWSQNL